MHLVEILPPTQQDVLVIVGLVVAALGLCGMMVSGIARSVRQ